MSETTNDGKTSQNARLAARSARMMQLEEAAKGIALTLRHLGDGYAIAKRIDKVRQVLVDLRGEYAWWIDQQNTRIAELPEDMRMPVFTSFDRVARELFHSIRDLAEEISHDAIVTAKPSEPIPF